MRWPPTAVTLLGGLAIGSLMASGLAVVNAAESEDADARQTAGLERLGAYASARPERFGLFWLDGAGRRVIVQVTDRASAQDRAAAREALGDRATVEFQPVSNSRFDLDQAHEVLNDPIRGGAGCSEQGGQRYHDVPDHSFGGVGPNSYHDGSYSDLGILYMGDIQGMSGHRIYKTDSDWNWSVDEQGLTRFLGQDVKQAGWVSGSQPGQVTSVNHTSVRPCGVTLSYQYKASHEIRGGDSGGPVFNGHTAWGINSGCVTDEATCDGDEPAVYTPISRLWRATDGPNGDPFNMKVCTAGDDESAC